MKKKSQKHFFFRTPKFQNTKIRNKQNFEQKISQNALFRKHQIQKKFAKILWKNLRRNIFVAGKISAKKNSIKKIFSKKKFVEKNFREKKFVEKNFREKIFSKQNIRKKF